MSCGINHNKKIDNLDVWTTTDTLSNNTPMETNTDTLDNILLYLDDNTKFNNVAKLQLE